MTGEFSACTTGCPSCELHSLLCQPSVTGPLDQTRNSNCDQESKATPQHVIFYLLVKRKYIYRIQKIDLVIVLQKMKLNQAVCRSGQIMYRLMYSIQSQNKHRSAREWRHHNSPFCNRQFCWWSAEICWHELWCGLQETETSMSKAANQPKSWPKAGSTSHKMFMRYKEFAKLFLRCQNYLFYFSVNNISITICTTCFQYYSSSFIILQFSWLGALKMRILKEMG